MAQVVARGASVWSADDRRLQVLGLTPRRVLAVRVAGAMVTAVAAVLTAVALMAAASPLAPVGPLHGSDPEAGVRLDLVVVAAGSAFILIVALASSALGGLRTENARGTTDGRPLSVTALSTSPTAMAGLNFANPSSGPNRSRAWNPPRRADRVVHQCGAGGAAGARVGARATRGRSRDHLRDDDPDRAVRAALADAFPPPRHGRAARHWLHPSPTRRGGSLAITAARDRQHIHRHTVGNSAGTPAIRRVRAPPRRDRING